MDLDKETIMYLIAIAGCAWGAFGQLGTIKKAAQNEGRLFAELQVCAAGISEIKNQVASLNETLQKNIVETARQDNRLQTLEREMKEVKEDKKGACP